MPSSTSRLESSDRRVGLAIALIVAAPLVWLTLLQTNYVLVYAACNDRSTVWLHVPSIVALATLTVVFGASVVVWRRMRGSVAPAPFLGLAALLFSGLCVVVLIATILPPFILRACD